jgi:hypothetical protein
MSQYDQFNVEQAHQYYSWAASDPRVVAIVIWPYCTWMPASGYAGTNVGLQLLPNALEAWSAFGRAIVAKGEGKGEVDTGAGDKDNISNKGGEGTKGGKEEGRLAAAGKATKSPAQRTCASNMDCSLNGQCLGAGTCACHPGWKGVDCGVLNLGPTGDSPAPGGTGRIYPAAGSNSSSWGGGVVFRDGKYHLYVSEMGEHCGLGTWNTNSFIRHAVSDTVDGIYIPHEVVLGAWAHNAMPWVTPDGGIAIFHIGNGTQSRPMARCAFFDMDLHSRHGFTLSTWIYTLDECH